MKIKQTKKDLENYLKEQLELLNVLVDAYDSGKTTVAKSIATVIRILVHDTKNSHSLLGQLNLKENLFFDSGTSIKKTINGLKMITSYAGIVATSVGQDVNYIPYLDESPPDCFGLVPFEEYWNRIVIIDNNREEFSRGLLVLRMANQDGGAHVDPEIDEKYMKLIRENSMGWKKTINNSNPEDLSGIELATMRQIGHEIIRTLDPSYPKKKMDRRGVVMIVGGMGFWSK
jgi:hypothetical protein